MICPIDHISYSAFTQYLKDRYLFKRKYIDRIYDEKDKPAQIVGKAFHKCLEVYYQGVDLEDAREAGAELVHAALPNIDFGNTGSLEEILKDYSQTTDHYFSESPYPREIVMASEEVMCEKVKGFKVQIKAVSDLILKYPGGGHDIVDFKKVNSLSKEDEIKGIYYIQAAFNYWAVCSRFKLKPSCMFYREVKTSKNRDGGPQTATVTINFNDPKVQEILVKIRRMVNGVIHEMSRKYILMLPNPQDNMSGQDSWLNFLQEA